MENLKTVILTNNQNKDFKAILNLNKRDGKIKFFNSELIKNNLALGIKTKSEVLKIPLEINNNNSQFSLPKDIDKETNVLCAVVDVSNIFCPQLILSGSANLKSENNQIENAFIKSKPEDVSSLYEQDTDTEINNLIDKNIQEDEQSIYYDSCAKCKYRKAFYEDCTCFENNKENGLLKTANNGFEEKLLDVKSINNGNSINDKQLDDSINIGSNLHGVETSFTNQKDESIKDNFDKIQDNSLKEGFEGQEFYMQVKPQLDALFSKYQPETSLNNLIASSSWVKVAYDGGQEYYVLGLIYNQENKNKVDFICYGVPSINKNDPPEDIKEYAQWLPLNLHEEDNDKGYFIVYQKASDGQTVNVEYV